MGVKSRGNYKGICMKFDCGNRNIICDKCHNNDKYLKGGEYDKKRKLDTVERGYKG